LTFLRKKYRKQREKKGGPRKAKERENERWGDFHWVTQQCCQVLVEAYAGLYAPENLVRRRDHNRGGVIGTKAKQERKYTMGQNKELLQ